MNFSRKSIRLLNGLSLLAALLLAFAPGISQLQHINTARWTELCTTEGLRRIQITADAGGAMLPAEQQPHTDCGYCLLQAGTSPAVPQLAAAVPSQSSVSVILHAYGSPYLDNTNSTQLGSRGPPQAL